MTISWKIKNFDTLSVNSTPDSPVKEPIVLPETPVKSPRKKRIWEAKPLAKPKPKMNK